uniref:DDE Tnp4 domain-containing protein n=1 Tax=Ananas comosus var. bracteatus TaxID=296719 RepID=A0A6V7QNB5_ANACO|nr:unnamed protein product [Ananas comosus var. bracteatus]
MHFPSLKTATYHSIDNQTDIVMACCVLHNFIRNRNGTEDWLNDGISEIRSHEIIDVPDGDEEYAEDIDSMNNQRRRIPKCHPSPSSIILWPRSSSGALPRRPRLPPSAAGAIPAPCGHLVSAQTERAQAWASRAATPPHRPHRPPVNSGDLPRVSPSVPAHRRLPPRAPAAAQTWCRLRPSPCGLRASLPPMAGSTTLPSTSGDRSSLPGAPPAAALPPRTDATREQLGVGSRSPRHRLPPVAGQHPPRTSRTCRSHSRQERSPSGRRRPTLAPTAPGIEALVSKLDASKALCMLFHKAAVGSKYRLRITYGLIVQGPKPLRKSESVFRLVSR